MEQDHGQLLHEALDRANKLLANIRREQSELASTEANLRPEQVREGRQALDNAARAAQRTIDALQSALSATPKLPDEELP